MKALQFNEDLKVELIETPIPQSNGEKVIVKVACCGVCGSDVHMFEHGSTFNHGVIPGHEFTGTVTDPGPRTDLKVGDRVISNFLNPCGQCPACKSGLINCCGHNNTDGVGLSASTPGGMAEYVACFPEYVYALPENVDFLLGTIVDPIAVALHAVVLGKVTIGSKVLITGGGAIGLCAAILCKRAGAGKVVVLETFAEKIERIPRDFEEVDAVVDGNDPQAVATLYGLSGGGFDVAIDCCGYAPALQACIYTLNANGYLILAGVSIDDVALPTVVVLTREINVKGSMAYTVPEYVLSIALAADPELRFRRVISREIGMGEAQATFEGMQHHNLPDYKISLNPFLP